MDMAGFAVNADIILNHPEAAFDQFSPRGYLESDFLVKLKVSLRDLEPKADNCTKVGHSFCESFIQLKLITLSFYIVLKYFYMEKKIILSHTVLT